jgi:hypothetical protein
MPRSSSKQAAGALSARLQARRPELEEVIIARVYGIADPTAVPGHEYVDGLRHAVAASLDYGFAAIENGVGGRAPPIPPELLVQARLAARYGVSHDTVLRRYCGGHLVFTDVLIEEAERNELPRSQLKGLFRAQASSFDRLLSAVSDEYGREADSRIQTSEQHRAEAVERLLAGELLDTSELAYDLEAYHLGLIATGPAAEDWIRALAVAMDRRPLVVPRQGGTIWAWLGSIRPVELGEHQFPRVEVPRNLRVAIGEQGEGLRGWRLTHRQAHAALPIALRTGEPLVHYADVALLASVLQDDLLSTSLRRLYLEPLERNRDGGEVARKTLRAYFAADRNVSSAAAALGVKRHTVTSRLRAIEEQIGHSLSTCASGIDAALRLDDLGAPRPLDTSGATI